MTLAIARNKTVNRKLGDVAVTHAAQASCSPDCVFMGSGCYAEDYPQMFTTRRLNQAALDATPIEIALAEAEGIDLLPAKKPMRLHVVGDCRTNEAAQTVSRAADDYREKHGQHVWTYTHSWREVERSSWGRVSVLASCETAADVAEAHARGYATALVVNGFQSHKRHQLGSVDALPCVQQTKKITCDSCRLCFDDQRLLEEQITILFDGHGQIQLIYDALKRRAA